MTAFAVAMVVVLLTVTGGGACVGSAVVGRHRAQSAADLAALAAAGRRPAGAESTCALAELTVQQMAARLADCRLDGLDVVVTVEVPVLLGQRGAAPARAVARAGPAEAPRQVTVGRRRWAVPPE